MSKFPFRWSVILGGTGIGLAFWLIFTSNAYLEVKKFLYTDPEIRSEFGEIKHSFLYSANIKNEHARFHFYLIGRKKNGVIALHAIEVNNYWKVKKTIQNNE